MTATSVELWGPFFTALAIAAAATLIYVLLSDTSNRNVSIKASKIKNEKKEEADNR